MLDEVFKFEPALGWELFSTSEKIDILQGHMDLRDLRFL
jgi:hypothetical protein